MNVQKTQFNEIYNKTYNEVLKFVICNSYNINDVNDIMQETYFEFYKLLNRKSLDYTNITAYIKCIAKNKIKKHYSYFYKIKLLSSSKDDIDLIETIKDDINLEKIIIDNEAYLKVWQYIKSKKVIVSKIFFLYYTEDLSIKNIAIELKISESQVKNYLYRTLKEIQDTFGKDSD